MLLFRVFWPVIAFMSKLLLAVALLLVRSATTLLPPKTLVFPELGPVRVFRCDIGLMII